MYIEKINKKTVQGNREELEKCNKGQRFKVSVIAQKRIIEEPVKPTLRELVEQLVVDMAGVKSAQKQQGEQLTKLDNKLDRVIELNNLKI